MRAARPTGVNASLCLRLAAMSALLGLASCGSRADLEPAPGQSLPVKPLMARSTPTPDELLTPPPYADPDRVDELMRQSTPRQADRFDLPPPSGQAPELPVGADEEEEDSVEDVGPVTPS